MAESHAPRLSIIIPMRDAMPYFKKTIASILEQSGGLDGVEVVIVDDGSKDTGRFYARRLQRRYPQAFSVTRLKQAGGVAHARNIGLSIASGEYVFFCDADDYFSPEAFGRMLAHADRWGSDILYVKQAGEGGRTAPRSMFHIDAQRADVFKSTLCYSLSCFKLYRRSFIERCGLSFPEDQRIDEDRIFALRALLDARTVSVASDYDYHHIVARGDGKNLSSSDFEFAEKLLALERLFSVAEAARGKGDIEEVIVPRIFTTSWAMAIIALAHLDDASRPKAAEQLRDTCMPYASPKVMGMLPVAIRALLAALAEGQYGFICDFIDDIDFLPDGTYQGYRIPTEDVSVEGGRAFLVLERGGYTARLDATRDIPLEYVILRAKTTKSAFIAEGYIETSGFWGADARLGVEIRDGKGNVVVEKPLEAEYSPVDGRLRWKMVLAPMESARRNLRLDPYLVVADGGISKAVRFGSRMAPGLSRRIEGAYWYDSKPGRCATLVLTQRGNISFSDKARADYLVSSWSVDGPVLMFEGTLSAQRCWNGSTSAMLKARVAAAQGAHGVQGEEGGEVAFRASLAGGADGFAWSVAVDFSELVRRNPGVSWDFFFSVQSDLCERSKRFGSELTGQQKAALLDSGSVACGSTYKPLFSAQGNLSYTCRASD